MGFLNKFIVLSFIFLILTSLIILSIKPVEVQAATKPSVPQQFSIKLIDNSYDVPPSQTTDPYTGTTATKLGYRVENKTIEITIKNQLYTPYTNAWGVECKLYYTIEFKGHFEENKWRVFRSDMYDPIYVSQSDSEYTVISYKTSGSYLIDFAVDSQVDFRVKAVIAYWTEPSISDHLASFHDPYLIEVESSNWSKTQTFTIPNGSSTSSPSQTTILPTNPTTATDNNQPQQPDQPQTPNFMTHPFFLLGIGALFAGVVIAVTLIFTKQYRCLMVQ